MSKDKIAITSFVEKNKDGTWRAMAVMFPLDSKESAEAVSHKMVKAVVASVEKAGAIVVGGGYEHI